MNTLYGIKNCDSVTKARKWLDDIDADYRFHDFRVDGLNAEQVNRWYEAVGDALVNRRSTTWKQLDEASRARLEQGEVVQVLLAHPTLIKRPVLECDEEVCVGFDAQQYTELFR